MGETVGAKPLYASTFVVHRDQQVGPHRLDLATQPGQLGTVFPVAAKQNHAPHQRVRQALAFRGCEAVASHVDDQGCVWVHGQ